MLTLGLGLAVTRVRKPRTTAPLALIAPTTLIGPATLIAGT